MDEYMRLCREPMTRAERFDRYEEQREEKYHELFDADIERQRAEWEQAFGADNQMFPFIPVGGVAHRKAIAALDNIERQRKADY